MAAKTDKQKITMLLKSLENIQTTVWADCYSGALNGAEIKLDVIDELVDEAIAKAGKK